METKHPKLEKPNQLIWSEDPLIHPKSYPCSFCKKAFSNAQALGGHMNIHRKDRAKLREETLLSLDSKKTTNTSTLDRVEDRHLISGIVLESSEEKNISSPKKKVSRDDNGSSASPRAQDSVEEDSGSVHVSSSEIGLDLELRLGPDSRAS